MKSDLVDIPARLIHETELAWLLLTAGMPATWIPKSACDFDGETLTLPEALAIDKGFI